MSRYINNYRCPQQDERPWGKWETLAVGFLSDSPDALAFCDKVITVNPSQKLSVQKHLYRQEHWEIVEGEVVVYLGPTAENMDTHTLRAGDTIFIPCGAWHRIENTGPKIAVFKERQSGIYLDEKDIIRFPSEDDPRGTDEQALIHIQNEVKSKALDKKWPPVKE